MLAKYPLRRTSLRLAAEENTNLAALLSAGRVAVQLSVYTALADQMPSCATRTGFLASYGAETILFCAACGGANYPADSGVLQL